MADRWNFVEDYIVCKYSHEHAWKDISAEQLDYLMSELKNAGFGSRSKTAVDKTISKESIIRILPETLSLILPKYIILTFQQTKKLQSLFLT